MISYSNNGHLVQSLSELPNLRGREIVLDFETTSGDDKLDSLNPWWHCSVAGICICVDDDPNSYYIPIGHKRPTPGEPNLDKQPVVRWLLDILQGAEVLIGQNIKYDAHVLLNDLGIDYRDCGLTLWDTLTQAKLVDSDRLDYSMKGLSVDWLREDISHYEGAFARYLFDGRGNRVCKDYGTVPALVLGEYGCQDVITTRKLKEYISRRRPASCDLVSRNELELTSVLFGIEQEGLCVDPMKVDIKKIQTLARLNEIIYRIQELTGIAMRPHTTEDCYNFLCGQYGLPILEWTEENQPSFGKSAMKSYLVHPKVREDATLRECVGLIQEYRVLNTFNALFLSTFQKRQINGKLHSSYNQCVRTGRLSCSDPNAQQMSSLAKELIESPGDEWMVVDIDLSQIEQRLVVSTINNPAFIASYCADAKSDFYNLVADKCGIDRDGAKALTLAMGFGAGRKRALLMIQNALSVSSKGYKESGLDFEEYCVAKSETMYDDYHRMLPELKPSSDKATSIARSRGYIRNLYGRHRRLSNRFCYKAFNAYIQSSAADIAKDLSLQIANYLSGVPTAKLIAVVHDSWVFYMHKSKYREHCLDIQNIVHNLKTPGTMRVPILCSVEVSDTNWKECKKLT